MARSNCILFALSLFWRRWLAKRRVTVDGERYFVLCRVGALHLLLRASRLGSVVPHMLYAERRGKGLRIIHFVPDRAKVKTLPPPLFRGHIKRGDFPDTHPAGEQ